MIAKIIQHLYIVGTYIVLKYDDSELKHIQTVHQKPKAHFFHNCAVSMVTAAILNYSMP